MVWEEKKELNVGRVKKGFMKTNIFLYVVAGKKSYK